MMCSDLETLLWSDLHQLTRPKRTDSVTLEQVCDKTAKLNELGYSNTAIAERIHAERVKP